MSSKNTKVNVKDYLFSNPVGHMSKVREREQLRDQLRKDVARWLAEGNVIDDRGVAHDDMNYRPAQVVTTSYYH